MYALRVDTDRSPGPQLWKTEADCALAMKESRPPIGPVIRHVIRALTEREVSDLLGLSIATLRAHGIIAARDTVPAPRPSHALSPADLKAFVRTSAVNAISEPSLDRQIGMKGLRSWASRSAETIIGRLSR